MGVPNPYPWYDSIWLAHYVHAKRVIRQSYPEKLDEFERALAPLRTRPDFQVTRHPRLITEDTLEHLLDTVDAIRPADFELHETAEFGRDIVHNHPVLTALQQELTGFVSDTVGEDVEPSYNFLSLYRNHGICEVHMDSPEAKYTLDICLRQSDPWPIHISQVVPWPGARIASGDFWEAAIRSRSDLRFEPHTLEPTDAIVFSGSSQWHYRDPQPGDPTNRFCDLVFLHFVPAGTRELVRPRNWAEVFGVPELATVTYG